jgi:Mrp family chromosome partitioning ATPase
VTDGSPPPTGGRAQWLAARARNALRRPLRIGGVSGLVFLTALLTLVLIPRHASRTARLLAPQPSDYPDTARVLARVASADSVVRAADSAVTRAEQRQARLATADTLPPALAARRDSLTAEDAELSKALQRAENAPLATSYRALAAPRELRDDGRVAILLDSLGDVERARVAFGEAGGVDPIYVALTTRLSAIGRSIEGIAADRRAAVRAELQQLGGSGPSAPAVLAAVQHAHTRRDSAIAADTMARLELAGDRQTVTTLQARAERARELANVGAPPIDLLAASLVLGAALGFAVTFGVEVFTPRVADAGEAERVTGVRTLAVIAPSTPNPERMRRKTDRMLSPLINASGTDYRLLYLGLAGTGLPLVTVTGDESDVVATIAANIAIAGALDSRSTLLVDADPRTAAASGIVAARLAPGVSDVLAGAVSWPEAIVPVVVGRDRSLDVIPAGSDRAAWPAEHGSALSAETLRAELSRLARRYDLLVIAAPAGLAQVGPDSVLPGRDVVLTARVAYTTLSSLTAAAAALRTSGMQLRGTVLWNADAPPVAPHRRLPSRSGSMPTVAAVFLAASALLGCAH